MKKNLSKSNGENVVNIKAANAKTAQFNWEDPLLLNSLLSEEETLIQSTAHEYAQSKLMPRVEEAFLDEKTDKEIIKIFAHSDE